MDIQPFVEVFAGLGGLSAIGLAVRWLYRSLSKTHRNAVQADTTQDLVDISLRLLQPAEDQITRLSTRLAEAEGRAEKLMGRIKELEAEAHVREQEMESLRGQVQELKTQLLDAQLEAHRLRALLSAD